MRDNEEDEVAYRYSLTDPLCLWHSSHRVIVPLGSAHIGLLGPRSTARNIVDEIKKFFYRSQSFRVSFRLSAVVFSYLLRYYGTCTSSPEQR